MLYLFLLHALGAIGGLLAKKCKIPAGPLLGAMVFVIVLNLVTGIERAYPVNLRVVVQVFSGIFIGLTFTRADIAMLHRMFKPVVLMVGVMFVLSAVFAVILVRFTIIDPVTAVFATAPGGLSDLVLIVQDFDADARQVALLHVFRFAFIVSFFPIFIRRVLFPRFKAAKGLEVVPDLSERAVKAKASLTTGQKVLRMFLTVLIAGSCAFLARSVGVPAGAVIGSIAATIALGAGAQKAFFPREAKVGVQIFAGCFIGSQITLQSLIYIQELRVPLAIVLIQVLVVTFGAAWVLRRFSTMDPASCLFSSVPGGMVEMGILGEELGLDVPRIILMHTCRLITVVSAMPTLLYLFLR